MLATFLESQIADGHSRTIQDSTINNDKLHSLIQAKKNQHCTSEPTNEISHKELIRNGCRKC